MTKRSRLIKLASSLEKGAPERRSVLKMIQASDTKTARQDGRWSVRDHEGGRSFRGTTKAKAVDKAVEWFVDGLQLISRSYK
jgi:hypothetical protein